MPSASPDPDEQRRIAAIVRQVSTPSFTELQAAATVDRRLTPAALRSFEQALLATVGTQQRGDPPTDSQLHRDGGPHPDAMRRLMRQTDLTKLPSAQLQAAVTAGMACTPSRLIVEARTQRIMGPDKYAVNHLQRPPGIRPQFDGRGAANTIGGIASALVLAECGSLIVPAALVPIAQGYWHPSGWPGENTLSIERALRERAALEGPFTASPSEVIDAVLAILRGSLTGPPATLDLDGVPVTGGRLRLGFPAGNPSSMEGTSDRYLGCTLRGIHELRGRQLVPFFEIPLPDEPYSFGHVEREGCVWLLEHNGERLPLKDLTERAYDPSKTIWVPAAAMLVKEITGGHERIFTATVTAIEDDLAVPVTIILVVQSDGQRDMFVTTLEPAVDGDLHQLITLVHGELARRGHDSPFEGAIRSLLGDCHLQTNRRRRHPERRSFAGLAQAAYAVRKLARVA